MSTFHIVLLYATCGLTVFNTWVFWKFVMWNKTQ